MNLLELTNHAIEQVDRFRSPDIDEWVRIIDPILKAVGECTIGRDTVDSIFIYGDHIIIETSYSARCCSQKNRMELSLDILNADDPIKAANKKRLGSELANAQRSFDESVGMMERMRLKIETLKGEILALEDS